MRESSGRSDEALVADARKGDRLAFGLLVRRYQNLVCAIAYGRLGDAESALDISQEAFLVSLEKLPQLRSGAKFAGWLRRITHNLCNRWERSETYRKALRAELGRRPSRATANRPEEVAETREKCAIVKRAMEGLPESLRVPLALHYFKGQSHAETARDLGISREAVVKRVERAKRQIRVASRALHMGYMTSQMETGLHSIRPDDEFVKRTLAAIPVGSVCGKLGLNVARISLAEAARHSISAAARHGSMVLTGGGAEVTLGKGILVLAGALLLAGGATAYLLARSSDADVEPAAAEAGVSESSGGPAVPMAAPSGGGQMRGASGGAMVPMAPGIVERPAAGGTMVIGGVEEKGGAAVQMALPSK
jgi:RNA polymerase sigma factor (sigma-70 family)